MTIPKPLRAWRGVLAAAFLPVAALAAQPQAVDPAALDVDQGIQKLKEQSLDIIQQAQSVEQSFLYPDYNRLSVYIGVKISGMVLNDISVSVDGGAPIVYQYPREEAVQLQLQNTRLHRLVVMNAPPGRHRIHAQFTSQYGDAKPTDPPFTGSFDGTFDKTEQQPADIELELRREGYLTRPELRLHDWRAAQ